MSSSCSTSHLAVQRLGLSSLSFCQLLHHINVIRREFHGLTCHLDHDQTDDSAMPQPLLFYGQRILEAGAILPLFTRGMIGNTAPRSPKPTSTVGVPVFVSTRVLASSCVRSRKYLMIEQRLRPHLMRYEFDLPRQLHSCDVPSTTHLSLLPITRHHLQFWSLGAS